MRKPRPVFRRSRGPLPLVLIAGLVVAFAALFSVMLLAERSSSAAQTQPSIAPNAYCTPLSSNIGPCEGLRAPDFSVMTIEGRTLSLSSLRGRVVILWFMAAWCPSCSGVASVLQQASAGNPNVVVIAVDMWSEQVLREYGVLNNPAAPPPEGPQQLSAFLRAYGDRSWQAVVDNFNLTRLYQLRYVDTTFVIDPKGVIVLRNDGPISPTVLLPALAKASAASP